MLREESLDCLELLVEERLALSSLITAEEREVVVVPVPVPSSVVSVSDVVEAELLLSSYSSSLSEQPETRINDSRRTENEKKFGRMPFGTFLYLKIKVPILSSFKGFFNGL